MNNTRESIMTERKHEIELFQQAVISSVASLVFAEYISNIKNRDVPVQRVYVPPVKYVSELLDTDGHLLTMLSERLINDMICNRIFIAYAEDIPDLSLFKYKESRDKLNDVLRMYIIPNISKHIPDTIGTKFNVNGTTQSVYEDPSIDLFDRQPLSDDHFRYIADETALHLLLHADDVERYEHGPLDGMAHWMTTKEASNGDFFFKSSPAMVLTINNQAAICPIHYNKYIIENPVSELLNFVTSTQFNQDRVSTSQYNQVTITELDGPQLMLM